MEFEQAVKVWLASHRKRRSGERLRRLVNGLGHAEMLFLKMWFAAFGNFAYLHPEYEVSDFKDGSRFLDFAYIRHRIRIALEVDGFNAHARGLDRFQFSDHLRRQNHLIIDGWLVLRFSYDDVKERPRLCQQTIQQLLGRLFVDENALSQTTVEEREIIRLAIRLGRPVKIADVQKALSISRGYAGRLLRQLAAQGLLQSASGQVRVTSYTLGAGGHSLLL